jgi:predicted SAM-dependent methyltransferase
LGRRFRTGVANFRSSFSRQAAIDDYFRSTSVRKVQIGSGSNVLEGWLNTDLGARPGVIYVNAIKPLPLSSGSVDYVFTEHMFEHITYFEGQRFLREVHRVLHPGGIVRIATPDLAFLVRLYADPEKDLHQRYRQFVAETFLSEPRVPLRGAVVNNFFYTWGHRFIYDFETLDHALRQAGFTGTRRCQPKESEASQLRNLESHANAIGEEFNELETIVVEATKP